MNKKTISKWSHSEVTILEELYERHSMAIIAEMLGRTKSSVQGKASAIGLSGKRETRTEEIRQEVAERIKIRPDLSRNRLSQLIGCPANIIKKVDPR